MNTEEFINKLESDYTKEEAFFIFNDDESYQDNEHINANKDGLKLFAAMLLRIAFNINPKRSEHQDDLFHLDDSFYLPNEGSIIHYISLSNKKRSDYPLPNNSYKGGIIEKLVPIGCIIVAISFVVLAIVGMISLVS